MRTEKEKLIAGELYMAGDEELVLDRQKARSLTRLYNQTTETELARRQELLKELFGSIGENVFIAADATL